jgi:hypothetical protein
MPNGWDHYRFYKAVKPDPTKHPFVIMLSEAKDGKPGHALIYGIGKTQVDVKHKDHRYARPVRNVTTHLESAAVGPAQLLFREKDAGTGHALVHFPLGSPPQIFPVALEKTGGSAGDHKSQCSFVYTAYAWPKTSGAESLGAGINPNASDSPFKRWDIGKMNAADFGLSLYDESGSEEPKVLLAWCNEVPEVATCED